MHPDFRSPELWENVHLRFNEKSSDKQKRRGLCSQVASILVREVIINIHCQIVISAIMKNKAK